MPDTPLTAEQYIELRSAIIAGGGEAALEVLQGIQSPKGDSMSETKCECPARQMLAELPTKISGSSGCIWIGGVVREDERNAALSAPCPCEGLREELAVANEGAQFYNRKAACAMVELNRAEAECDRLRAKGKALESGMIRWKSEAVGSVLRLEAERNQLRAELVEAEKAREGLREELENVKQLREKDVQHALGMHRVLCEYSNASATGKYDLLLAERDQLREKLSETTYSRDLALEGQRCAQSGRNRLRTELAEAQKDVARLDWLENELTKNRYHMDIALQSDEEDGVWFAKFYRRTGAVHGVAYDWTDSRTQTVRTAIDAAVLGQDIT